MQHSCSPGVVTAGGSQSTPTSSLWEQSLVVEKEQALREDSLPVHTVVSIRMGSPELPPYLLVGLDTAPPVKPRERHTTRAALELLPNESSHTVPQAPFMFTSRRPWRG